MLPVAWLYTLTEFPPAPSVVMLFTVIVLVFSVNFGITVIIGASFEFNVMVVLALLPSKLSSALYQPLNVYACKPSLSLDAIPT